jgi:hypothetical protein
MSICELTLAVLTSPLGEEHVHIEEDYYEEFDEV